MLFARATKGGWWLRGLAPLAAFAFCACVATEPPMEPRGVAVSSPPPAPRLEAQRPPQPAGDAVWIEGYWHWTGMQYAWIPGHWEAPHPGARWAAPRYTQQEGGYYYEPGAWRPAPTANANALR
jgi:hypothetical protein